MITLVSLQMMVDYLKDLHPFYVSAVGQLKRHDILELTEAIAHIVSSMPPEKLLESLQNFMLPIAQRIHEVVNTLDASSSEACKELEGATFGSLA
jgi:transportin-3